LGNAQSDENVATDPPAEVVEEIRDFLAKVIEEQDLDPTAVKIAAAQLGTTADDQMSDN
jgi:rRNA maturation endonuclease Nob1